MDIQGADTTGATYMAKVEAGSADEFYSRVLRTGDVAFPLTAPDIWRRLTVKLDRAGLYRGEVVHLG
jgi:hypothetical protein